MRRNRRLNQLVDYAQFDIGVRSNAVYPDLQELETFFDEAEFALFVSGPRYIRPVTRRGAQARTAGEEPMTDNGFRVVPPLSRFVPMIRSP